MQSNVNRSAVKRLFAGTLVATIGLAAAAPTAQSVSTRQATERVRTALERLPRYGVFDFVGFELDRGSVTLVGYAYHGHLKSDAGKAVSRLDGIEEVGNQIEVLPASQNDRKSQWWHQEPGIGSNVPSPIARSDVATRSRISSGSPIGWDTSSPSAR